MRLLVFLTVLVLACGCVGSPPVETTSTSFTTSNTATSTTSTTMSTSSTTELGTTFTTTELGTTPSSGISSSLRDSSTTTTRELGTTTTTSTTPTLAKSEASVVCAEYDYNQAECLLHAECKWMPKERLCESIYKIGDDDSGFSENWRNMVADDSGWVGIDPSIDVDVEGNPYVSHYDQCNRDLKHAWFDGAKWNTETVDSNGDVGEESGIAVDKQGGVHISYVDATTGALKYAVKKENSWTIQTVDKNTGYRTMATSIALDGQGNPHIAYAGPSKNEDKPGIVKYARWNVKEWLVESVTDMASDVYLALDSNDVPHLSFKKESGSTDRIQYATKKSGSWKLTVVDSKTKAGGDTGIAVDSNNNPHIVYNDYGSGGVKYAVYDGSSWSSETVASNVGKGEGLKIAVDGDDKPNVIYSDNKKENLMYAVKDGNTWLKETVDKMGNPAITVDSIGQVHVAHGRTREVNAREYCSSYDGDEEEIEILKYSVRETELGTTPLSGISSSLRDSSTSTLPKLADGKTLDERLDILYSRLHTGGSGAQVREYFPDFQAVYVDEGHPDFPGEILPFTYYYSQEANITVSICSIDLTVFICPGKLNRLIGESDFKDCSIAREYLQTVS